MSVTLPAQYLAALAGRLTDRKDRETYAALMSYLNSLPPGDELVRLAELFGLLSLLGERLPVALAEAMTELRELTTASGDYHAKVDARLAEVPAEIIAGVDVAKMAKEVGEAFRQQLTTTGLRDTAAALQKSCGDIQFLSDHITARLAPLSESYTEIADKIASELNTLTLASRKVQAHNAQLVHNEPAHSWAWQSVLLGIMFLMGGLCGVVLEKNETVDVLASMNVQMERMQTPASAPMAERSKKSPR